jgi:hypothetical protein
LREVVLLAVVRECAEFDFALEVAVFGFDLVTGFGVDFADDGAVSANTQEHARTRIPASGNARSKYQAKRLMKSFRLRSANRPSRAFNIRLTLAAEATS